jgi:hypothetical protein
MLVEITIGNKRTPNLYSFLVRRDFSGCTASEILDCEDLQEILDKELKNQPKSYFGVARSLETNDVLLSTEGG